MKKAYLIFLLACLLSCKQDKDIVFNQDTLPNNIAAISLMGKELLATPPSQKLIAQHETHKANYLADTNNVDKLIWYARFEAYKVNYNEAIALLTKGIKKFPNDPRLYRHRGHRYISVRNFDAAIDDFEKAAQLIDGTKNEIEPDGMPNAKNIPVSTLHGNIWYHLGLAYYLKNDMPNALRGFENCLTSGTNDDNIVSSTHWLYMIQRRMGKMDEANRYLKAIKEEMDIIENFAYHDICLFYKGVKSIDDLSENKDAGPSNDAVAYAVANWYLYNDDLLNAKPAYDKILSRSSWNSFGYIAAESDFVREF